MSIFLVIMSGILIVLPFFIPDLFFISWIGLIPFLYSLYNTDFENAFIKGWLLGTMIMAGVGYSLYNPLRISTDLNSFFIILIISLLFIAFAFIYGLWIKFYQFLEINNSFNPLIFSFSWVLLEYSRYIFLGFFPLGYLGYTQTNFTHFIQIADLGGVFLVSFLVVLINSCIFKLIYDKKYYHLITIILLFVIVFSYGTYRLNYFDNLKPANSNYINVGIIQTNINQNEKWLSSNIEKNNNMILSSIELLSGSDLIITPESALTYDLSKESKYRSDFFAGIETEQKTYYQLGSLAEKDGYQGKFNSSFLSNPQKEFMGRYDKNKLVLFGEKVMFKDLLAKYTGNSFGSLEEGDDVTIFKSPFAEWKVLICSEILYPEYSLKKFGQFDFIINQSNEAWFGNNPTIKDEMWFASIFRAVENRSIVLRAGNHTHAGLIYPTGEGINIAEKQQRQFKVEIKTDKKPTIYQRYGSSFGIILLIILTLLISFKYFYRQNN